MTEIDKIILVAGAGDGNSLTGLISELKSKRFIAEPPVDTAIKQIDPTKHEVFNRISRPDKRVKVDSAEAESGYNEVSVTEGGADGQTYRIEPVARVALAIQKLIVKRAVSFLFGNPVTLEAEPSGANQKAVLLALKKVLHTVKEKSLNRRVAMQLFSATEVAELWYPVERPNGDYGFESKFKLRCAVLSPLLGDTLYPYFDETGDMVAFSREFDITVNGKSKKYFETYTDTQHYMWVNTQDGWAVEEGYPKENVIGKIPVVFGNQPETEWSDVQVLIERLEKLLSNFADTNDYHASPKIFVQGAVKGFAKKGESGAIIEGEDGATASYLSWEHAPESVRLEIDTLLRMIYTLTQTPDISFDAVKGIGAISGVALKLLFLDAHLKVADHQMVFDEYLQRRISIILAYIGKFNTRLEADARALSVEPVITPYMVKDEAAELKIWQDANGGNPIISQKASFQKAGLTNDPEADYSLYKQEETAKMQFSLNEPTV